jgi:hypothetical protein
LAKVKVKSMTTPRKTVMRMNCLPQRLGRSKVALPPRTMTLRSSMKPLLPTRRKTKRSNLGASFC